MSVHGGEAENLPRMPNGLIERVVRPMLERRSVLLLLLLLLLCGIGIRSRAGRPQLMLRVRRR
jgi:hypothetical protein